MNAVTIERQAKAMRRQFPALEFQDRSNSVMWIGPVKPKELQHKIMIEAQPFRMSGTTPWSLTNPIVRVLDPPLRSQSGVEEAPLPHVYYDPACPKLSPLCLFDPRDGEWQPTMLLTETIMPWTCEWLLFYEIWSATGKWLGGGRHPTSSEEDHHQ